MTEIIMFSKFGEKKCVPFQINRVQDNSDEEEQINSDLGQDASNQDTEDAINLTDE